MECQPAGNRAGGVELLREPKPLPIELGAVRLCPIDAGDSARLARTGISLRGVWRGVRPALLMGEVSAMLAVTAGQLYPHGSRVLSARYAL